MATLLPPGKSQFLDSDGKPLAGGTVTFYIPGTTTLKSTWQDSAQTTPNTNPVVLDGSGMAVILGTGAYRMVVADSAGNQLWDQNTSDAISSAQDVVLSGTLTVNGSSPGTEVGWAYGVSGGSAFSGPAPVSINAGGDVLANAYISVSDARLKTDIADVYLQDAFRFVRGVRSRRYAKNGVEREVGFLAQDVLLAHFPEMVTAIESPDARLAKGDGPAGKRLGVKYNHAIAYHQTVLAFLIEELADAKRRLAALGG